MKRIFLLLIAILSFTACSNDDSEEQETALVQAHKFVCSADNIVANFTVVATINFNDGSQTTPIDYEYMDNAYIVVDIPSNASDFRIEFNCVNDLLLRPKMYGLVDDVYILDETVITNNYVYTYTF